MSAEDQNPYAHPGSQQGPGPHPGPAPGQGYPPPPQGYPGGYGQQPPGGPYGQQAYGYGPMMQPRKEPALSLIIAFFLPGVGSMVNGDVEKGIGILVGYVISWFLIIVLVGILGVVAFWVWGMVDAYQGAVAFNRRQGYPG